MTTVYISKPTSLYRCILATKQAALAALCTVLVLPVSVQAMPVVNGPATAQLALIQAAIVSGSISQAAIATKQTAMDAATIADLAILPELPVLLKPVVTSSGGVPDPDDKVALLLPDAVLLDAIRIKEYKFGLLPISSSMCPSNGVAANALRGQVPNMLGYTALQAKMCDRIHNLKAYKVRMTEGFRDKINKIQIQVAVVIAHPGPTTGSNAAKQTALQTLQALEQLVRAEYRGNMALADAKIVVATDIMNYSNQALVNGPPTTPLVAFATQTAKTALGFAINAAVTNTAPYNK
jgi:hypothetical protein